MNTLRSWLLTGLLVSALAQSAVLAQIQKGYNIGDAITDFHLKNVDGRIVSLADYRTQKGIIIVFTSTHCPFAKTYEDRLRALDQKFAPQGYPVLAIMPNDPNAYEEDSFASMKARAQEKDYPYPYVMDDTQSTAHTFGATRTPQIYVVKRTNGQFILEYVGTIDDNPQDGASAQRHYVDEAVNNLLAGRPVQSPMTKPIGCGIKWK
ncbi:thioredoxin family protein [Spirosoma sp.]|uniref:thioredoxin family protein n=1 Tax=Spirosoma sp. TaxID=1899569 RepID=UPI003B3A05C4